MPKGKKKFAHVQKRKAKAARPWRIKQQADGNWRVFPRNVTLAPGLFAQLCVLLVQAGVEVQNADA